jgi:uncharacterized protein (DUF885 family)
LNRSIVWLAATLGLALMACASPAPAAARAHPPARHAPAAPAAEPQPNAALAALFEREFQWQLKEFPEQATFVGDDRYNDRLSDESAAAVARHRAHRRAVLAELAKFKGVRLDTQDRISLALATDRLQRAAEVDAMYGPLPFEGLNGWMVVGPTGGPQFELPTLAKATPLRNAHDYDNYLQRLAAVPVVMGQLTERMRAGLRSGWVPPQAVMAKVPEQFDLFVADDVTASPLYEPFRHFPVDMGEADKARLAEAARRALADQVRPAFVAMKQFLVQQYIPGCRQQLGASTLPAGPAYYALAVRENTTTPLTPQQVHDIGLREVARIHGEMDKVIAGVGFKGTRNEFIDSIRKDPRFYFTKPEDMLMAYRDIAKRVDAELPKLFATLPRLPYGIRAMEPYEGDNAEHYTPGAADGSRAGWFEANVLSLSTRPKYEMEDTLLHEAVPGHHLQTARAQEIPGLPAFRRNGWYVAYGEGWALYAESLGPELGMYRDPYSKFGALSWEAVRACRLVIDTGLHAFGWTREQAIRYMVDNAGIAEGFATAEVDRYIVDPGQALGYKIGELKIKALRAKAEAALGEHFDIRHFHNALLDDGPLPLTILEQRIDEWIAGQQRMLARQPAGAAGQGAAR